MSAYFLQQDGAVQDGVPSATDLPEHLQKKARTTSPKSKAAVLAKEAMVAENRAQFLNQRVEAAQAHVDRARDAVDVLRETPVQRQ